MNSPYNGKFRVSQCYSAAHTGLDLVGVDDKTIHSTINGTVIRAGWENENNEKQGFGKRVVIRKSGTDEYYFFGHLSEILVTVGQTVRITDVIGIEGSTGYSTGTHCHYECRKNDDKAQHQNISQISGIPNKIGTYDDGYRPPAENIPIEITLNGATYSGAVKKK